MKKVLFLGKTGEACGESFELVLGGVCDLENLEYKKSVKIRIAQYINRERIHLCFLGVPGELLIEEGGSEISLILQGCGEFVEDLDNQI